MLCCQQRLSLTANGHTFDFSFLCLLPEEAKSSYQTADSSYDMYLRDAHKQVNMCFVFRVFIASSHALLLLSFASFLTVIYSVKAYCWAAYSLNEQQQDGISVCWRFICSNSLSLARCFLFYNLGRNCKHEQYRWLKKITNYVWNVERFLSLSFACECWMKFIYYIICTPWTEELGPSAGVSVSPWWAGSKCGKCQFVCKPWRDGSKCGSVNLYASLEEMGLSVGSVNLYASLEEMGLSVGVSICMQALKRWV